MPLRQCVRSQDLSRFSLICPGGGDVRCGILAALREKDWMKLGPPARRARDDLHPCILVSTPMKAETGVTASGERFRIRDARPPDLRSRACPKRFVHVHQPRRGR
jgi:hypothetical protein